MAELMFAATLDESCRILQSILDRGDLYAVEKYVRDPQTAEHITKITEEMRARWSESWSTHLYLFGSYSTYPPHYVSLKDQYYVNSLVAGPCFGLRLWPGKQGRLSDQNDLFTEAFYLTPAKDASLTPEQLAPMREVYADCVKRAKRFLVRYQLKDSAVTLWIGRESRELVESGQLCLYWADKHYSAGKWYPGPRPEQWPVPVDVARA
jgi:hypothetical protein